MSIFILIILYLLNQIDGKILKHNYYNDFYNGVYLKNITMKDFDGFQMSRKGEISPFSDCETCDSYVKILQLSDNPNKFMMEIFNYGSRKLCKKNDSNILNCLQLINEFRLKIQLIFMKTAQTKNFCFKWLKCIVHRKNKFDQWFIEKPKVACNLCKLVPPRKFMIYFNNLKKKGSIIINSNYFKNKTDHPTSDEELDYWNFLTNNSFSAENLYDKILQYKMYGQQYSKMSNLVKKEPKYPYYTFNPVIVCKACKIVSKIIFKGSKEAIYKELMIEMFKNEICDMIFTSDKDCLNFISFQFDSLWIKLVNRIRRNELCAINCGPNAKDYNISFADPKNVLCTATTGAILNIAYNTPFKFRIEQAIEKWICKDKFMKQNECDIFLGVQLDYIFSNMFYLVNNDDFCRVKKPINENKRQIIYILKDTEDCSYCLNTIRGLEHYIRNKDLTMKLFDKTFNERCLKLYSSRLKCRNWNNLFGKQIKSSLKERKEAAQICKELKQCIVIKQHIIYNGSSL